jgi:CubicO group peptidase (beta-lactamase class C family)
VVHALVGMCVRDGELAVEQPAPVPEWAGDDRRHITIDHLLAMSSGLRFVEDYVDDATSDVIDMLFGEGVGDVAGYAVAKPIDHAPGTVWNYSSGTSNILARIVGDVAARRHPNASREQAMRSFLHDELFGPLGMASADPRFDAAGTFVGSSFLYATARDFARFGYLYLRDGRWGDEHGDRQLLPPGWVEHARTPPMAPVPATETFGYGRHWWLWDRHGLSTAFGAHGYEQQRVVVDPARDLVVVRLAKTPSDLAPNVEPDLVELVRSVPVDR